MVVLCGKLQPLTAFQDGTPVWPVKLEVLKINRATRVKSQSGKVQGKMDEKGTGTAIMDRYVSLFVSFL